MDISPEILAAFTFAGIFIGIWGVVFGASAFLSFPLFQLLLPGVGFGAVVGNSKVGAFFRSLGSTWATRKEINWKQVVTISIFPVIFSIAGASFISHLDQKWLFPAIIFSVAVAEFAPYIGKKIQISKNIMWFFSAFVGIYAGFLGAGISILIIALFRLQSPNDTDIAHIKIQSRVIEFLLLFATAGTHLFSGSIVFWVAVSWSIGTFIGGIIGGHLLLKMTKISGKWQKIILRISFGFAIVVAGIKFFNSL